MAEADIYAALNEIFSDVFLRDDIELRPDLSAKDVAGWDSFKQIDIILAVEEKYGIKFNTRELDSLHNVGDLVRVIVGKTQSG
jgi:acyl carrier protein